MVKRGRKSKLILVSYNSYPQTPSAFLPDNGLASLAACIIKAGHEVKILDFNTPEAIQKLYGTTKEELEDRQKKYCTTEIADQILAENPDLVGIKMYTGEGFRGCTLIAEEVKKKNPKIYVVGAGPHVDTLEKKYLELQMHLIFLQKEREKRQLSAFQHSLKADKT